MSNGEWLFRMLSTNAVLGAAVVHAWLGNWPQAIFFAIVWLGFLISNVSAMNLVAQKRLAGVKK